LARKKYQRLQQRRGWAALRAKPSRTPEEEKQLAEAA
jgi:hypothetical protein